MRKKSIAGLERVLVRAAVSSWLGMAPGAAASAL